MTRLEKGYSDYGVNGPKYGQVVVELNYRDEIKEVHNRVLHEETLNRIYYHRVVAQSGAWKKWSQDFTDENKVEFFIADMEQMLKEYLRKEARNEKQETVIDKLKNLGFK